MKIKYYIIGAILSALLIGCEPICTINSADVTNMYSSYIEEWKSDIVKSFDEAEKEIFKPIPRPDDLPKPHPDPAKCICKGKGIIVHGDGHTTQCEFHGKKDGQNITRKDSYVR